MQHLQQTSTGRIVKRVIILLIAIIPQLSPAQTQLNIDQLLQQLSTAKQDTNKVNLLDRITNYYRSSDKQKALQYGNQELELSARIGWIKGQIICYRSLADIYFYLGEYQNALNYYQKGYDLAIRNKLVDWQYRMLGSIGDVNMQMKNYDQGIAELKTSLEYFQHAKDVEEWSNSAFMIGLGYVRQYKDSSALIFYQQILEKYLSEKDTLAILQALRNFSLYYGNWKNDPGNALNYDNRMLTYFPKTDTSFIHATQFLRIASDYVMLGMYVKALEYFRLAIALKPGDVDIQDRANYGMRGVYATLGDYHKVLGIDIERLQKAQLTNNPDFAYTYVTLANDYIQLKQYDQAVLHLNKAKELNNKLESSKLQADILTSNAYVYYLTKRYDEALGIVKDALGIKEANSAIKNRNARYLGMIIRDAPDEVLQKHGISPADRYPQAIRNMQLALDYFKSEIGKRFTDDLQHCYKELSTTYKMMNDYKGFAETYPLYIAMKDSSLNLENQNALISRLSEIQSEKKEDSLRYQQRITAERLQRQTLLFTQQQQTLLLNRQELTILGNEKKLQDLSFQKTQANLQSEQNMRRANEQQLKAAAQKQALDQTTLQLQKAEIKTRRNQGYYFMTGIAALLILSFFIARNYYNQRTSNKAITAEKKRSDNLLLNILPADVAEELKEKGSANARLFEEVTVLFTDFVNFTTISELLTPQELVDELHYCFKAFDEMISTYTIEKIKTIGDAYLAVAGLPHADPHHAENTIKAALEIRQFIQDRKKNKGNKSFDIRIGIHSGSVVAGIVGVKKFAYDIWGDTVNTAARMEQHSMPGQINVSEKTYELVKDQFAFTYRGEIEAKNKGALKMYFVEKQSASMYVSS